MLQQLLELVLVAPASTTPTFTTTSIVSTKHMYVLWSNLTAVVAWARQAGKQAGNWG
jgi:hypothetical protein